MQEKLQRAVNFLSPENTFNPYPTYQEIQANSPVYYDEGMASWMVSLHEDVKWILKATHVHSNIYGATLEQVPAEVKPFLSYVMAGIGAMDGPEHLRLRGLLHSAFGAAFVEKLRGSIQTIVDELLDDVLKQGEVDLRTSFAFAIPYRVITSMLNIPHEDHEKFERWVDGFLKGISLGAGFPEWLHGAQVVQEMETYFLDLIAKRREENGTDLITMLIRAEEQGDRLKTHEIIPLIMALLVAGYETTTNLVLNGTLALIRNPDQWQLLKERPAELVETAVEELLRYDTPVQFLPRIANQNFTLRGQEIAEGDKISVMLGATNYDRTVFDDPEKLDLAREKNPHISFGFGPHFCAGVALGRLEGRIIFETMARRIQRIELLETELEYSPMVLLRSLKSLRVRVQ